MFFLIYIFNRAPPVLSLIQACKKISFLHHLYSDVPNAGQGLKRLDFKQDWDVDLREYMKKLDAKKPVILCGDLNVAHLEIGKWLYHSSISIALTDCSLKCMYIQLYFHSVA